MWTSPVGILLACVAASFSLGHLKVAAETETKAEIETEASANNLLYTTTNVLRERPSMENSLELEHRQQQQQHRHLSETGYYQNTYNPWSKAAEYKDEDKDNTPTTSSLSRNIPWGAINIVVVTDVHSWIGGNHKDDPRHWPYDANRLPNQDADYGDVLSFYQRLENLVEDHNANANANNNNNKRDLFFVMNGDFVDGTGFSGYPPTHLEPLLQHMPWDAVNVGNHELYHDETIQYIIDQQQKQQQQQESEESNSHSNHSSVHRWNKRGYLSSNTVLNTNIADNTIQNTNNTQPPSPPMTGNRYTYLEGKHTNTTILAFGFLYDFDEGGSLTYHQNVRDTIQEEWFQSVLGGRLPTIQENKNEIENDAPREFDAILVLAHMDCLHSLVKVILDGIRSALPPHKREIPIQFVTGHTHRRCHSRLDAFAETFEAGRFLDTIGFVSLDNLNNRIQTTTDSENETKNNTNNKNDSAVFRHRFWNANRKSLHEILSTEQQDSSSSSDFDRDFGTPEGRSLTLAIHNTQSELGLDEVLGCSPHTYGIFAHPKESSRITTTNSNNDPSLFDLYLHQMLPNQLLAPMYRFDKHSGEPVFVSGTSVLRYSLFEGPVTVNDVIAIEPFNNTIHEVMAFDEELAGSEPITADIGKRRSLSLPIYGWQLLGLLDAANELYSTAGEYGLKTFVLSTLPSSTSSSLSFSSPKTITSARKSIDPEKLYRIFCTDYDAARLLSAVAIVKQEIEDHALLSSGSFTKGRLYKSQLAHPDHKNSGNEDNCYIYLMELWKAFVREQMPCGSETIENHPSLRISGLFKAQILHSPSAASAKVHSRMTPAQEDLVLASDQKAAAMLAVAAFAMIVFLMIHPPESNLGRKGQAAQNSTSNRESKETSNHHPEHGVSLQLIPLCRYNTGNLSEGSYGSI